MTVDVAILVFEVLTIVVLWLCLELDRLTRHANPDFQKSSPRHRPRDQQQLFDQDAA
jgi:hypothetical protein